MHKQNLTLNDIKANTKRYDQRSKLVLARKSNIYHFITIFEHMFDKI